MRRHVQVEQLLDDDVRVRITWGGHPGCLHLELNEATGSLGSRASERTRTSALVHVVPAHTFEERALAFGFEPALRDASEQGGTAEQASELRVTLEDSCALLRVRWAAPMHIASSAPRMQYQHEVEQ